MTWADITSGHLIAGIWKGAASLRRSKPAELGFRYIGGSRCATWLRTYSIQVESGKAPEFIDITSQVQEVVTDAQIQNGFAIVFSKHTTAAIKINENEPLLIHDMEDFLERLAPRHGEYRHNDFSIRTVNITDDECPNGHAHCQQLLLGATETIPIVDSVIQCGRWQSVFLIELDRPRTREVLVQVMGE